MKSCVAISGFLALNLIFSDTEAAGLGSAEGFAKLFVDAVSSRSTERRLELLHPKSRACINSQTEMYYSWIFSRQMRYVIPDARYKVSVELLPEGRSWTTDGKSNYPVRPSHQLQIDIDAGPNNSSSLVFLVVRDGSRWLEVLPCPRLDAVADARRSTAEFDRQEQRARKLAAELANPLRAEVIALARAGRRVDAIRKYAAASGEELVIARRVVDLLMAGNP